MTLLNHWLKKPRKAANFKSSTFLIAGGRRRTKLILIPLNFFKPVVI